MFKKLTLQAKQKLGPIWPFLMVYLLGLFVLGLARLFFMVWQWDRVTAVDGIFSVFAIGLRIDTILVCQFVALPVVLYFLVPDWGTLSHFIKNFARFWVVGASLLFVFMEVSTPSYILEYGTRPSRIFVEYLIYPKEVFGTLWASYKTQLFIAAVLLTVTAIYGGRFYKRLFDESIIWSWPKRLLAFPVVALILFLGIRSSLGHRPANPSIASFSNDHLVNDLALNSTYNVLFAIYNLKHEVKGDIYGKLKDEEIIQGVRDATLIAPDAFKNDEIPSLHQQISSVQREKLPNLVIVLEESLGAQFVSTLGGDDLTPELDKWSKKGLWFTSMYATGTRSVRGIEAIIAGFTPSPSRSVVKLERSQTGFYTIARTLKNLGYTTEFIYGGEGHFDNMQRFFLGNGFDTVIDIKDYEDPIFLGTWGASDEDLFKKAHTRLLEKGDNPYFSLVFTSSFHSPFEYPDGRIEPVETPAFTRRNAVKYADYALGKFLARAEKSEYWKNTLFLVVADHDSRVYGDTLVPIKHFHIPALITGLGGEIRPGVYSKVSSQIDLPPTLFSLMGIASEHPMIGRDLTQVPEDVPGRALFQYEKNFAYMLDNKVVVFLPQKDPQSFVYQNKTLVPSDDHSDALIKTALAHVLWTSKMYQEQRYRLP